jgi:ubiquinone/menaquinone biosynthesis C-methylase UbiE
MNISEKSRNFFDVSDNYLSGNPIIPLRKLIINDLLGDVSGKEIIDIGCGNGDISKGFLQNNKVTFLDFSSKMLEYARAGINSELFGNSCFINSDLNDFKTDKKFDIIICIGVIAHVDDICKTLKKLKELSSEEGLILLQFSDSDRIISRFNKFRKGLLSNKKLLYNYEVNLTSYKDLRILFNEVGFSVINEVSYLPVSPFFSIFRSVTKYRLLVAAYRSKIGRLVGSELILALRNNQF